MQVSFYSILVKHFIIWHAYINDIKSFTFDEYFSGIGGDLRKAWLDYYTFGGLPQVALLETEEKKTDYLRSLYETTYPLPMSMNDLEQALDPARFFRLNRQYIANIKGIRKISLYFGSKLMVKLKGCEDDNIVISKEKATLFKKWLEK